MPIKVIQDTANPEEKIITQISYPQNYADADGTFISDLKSLHIVSAPIEQARIRQTTPQAGPIKLDVIVGIGDNL